MERLDSLDLELYKIKRVLEDCDQGLNAHLFADEIRALKQENLELDKEQRSLIERVKTHIDAVKKLMNKMGYKR